MSDPTFDRPLRCCSHCRMAQPLDQFWRDKSTQDGLALQCKLCKGASIAAYYGAHSEAVLARQKTYRDNHLERTRVSFRTWLENNRQRFNDICRETRARHPERHHARVAVGRAVKLGLLLKPSVCSHCQQTVPVEAHHQDYSQPLAVIWLCRPCHRKQDAKLLQEKELSR